MSYHNLTQKEFEVAVLAMKNLSNNQIGEILNISPLVVRNHLVKIFLKLGIKSRQEIKYKLSPN